MENNGFCTFFYQDCQLLIYFFVILIKQIILKDVKISSRSNKPHVRIGCNNLVEIYLVFNVEMTEIIISVSLTNLIFSFVLYHSDKLPIILSILAHFVLY